MKVLVVLGTRPEAIKLGPVVLQLWRIGMDVQVCDTSQQDMVGESLDAFSIKADYKLPPAPRGLAMTVSSLLARLSLLYESAKPDWVVVQGDTSSAFAGAVTAFYAGIPVSHVEAGLRSNDPARPFPEEMNRRLIDQIARLRFAPTEAALNTLKSEQLGHGSFNVGNTVVDAMRILHPTISDHAVRLPPDPIVLVTAHRRESFGAPMESICRAILRIVDATPAHVMLPVHPNPGASEPIERLLSGHPQIHLMPPLPYGELLYVLSNAYLVLTDSGGIQEEAPTFGVPLLVLRDVTERPEGIEAGVALLVGTDETVIASKATEILTDPRVHQSMCRPVSPYGDGHAAERIATIIAFTGTVGLRQETGVA